MQTDASSAFGINRDRLLARLDELGAVGKDPAGGRTRHALTLEDREARDLIVGWFRQAKARVCVDRIGNIYGVLGGELDERPVMIGSHIDTVTCAGALDGCYGVIAGIEVLQALSENPLLRPQRIAVAAFTNEEGVRFAPDLLGSRVLARDMDIEDALATCSRAGVTVGQELKRIGYAGEMPPWELLPRAFLELHIEQGPVLDAERVPLGIVESVQGHSWWQIEIAGTANHAGTTPMHMRRDAGMAAMTLATHAVLRAADGVGPNVGTIGTIAFEPNAINVVPGRATFTIDFRDCRDEMLVHAEQWLQEALRELRLAGFSTLARCLSRHAPVHFDQGICAMLEDLAAELGLVTRRMRSGASHDAQMLARVCPTAMIFVPSRGGISHNPQEHTDPDALFVGAHLLLHATLRLAHNAGDSR
ncbi:MAG: M20 family metallo-hydrolase [Proteobacteria bacterium]|nr:M20 family metallo-hydrolase [Pseudomonadota bacterium]